MRPGCFFGARGKGGACFGGMGCCAVYSYDASGCVDSNASLRALGSGYDLA